MERKQNILSDKELWKDFISGENDAFKTIYEKHFSDLYKYGCYFSKDEDLVKDCIQDLFINLHNYRTRLKPIDRIKPYLIASFKRNLFNKLRLDSEGKKRQLRIDNLPFDYSFPDKTGENDDNKIALLQNAMSELTARQREAIYLKYVTGLSYNELSAIMNLSYQASRNLIYHGMERLRIVIANKTLLLFSIIMKFPFLKRAH
ncbi:MAG: sigma-70 family RNA polymerase sigma factor [Prolixibacteraceae bacterium]|nr:sigma-70 family RNA polymerase sigma factor [Prolixibacteraceae bacterium]